MVAALAPRPVRGDMPWSGLEAAWAGIGGSAAGAAHEGPLCKRHFLAGSVAGTTRGRSPGLSVFDVLCHHRRMMNG